ncbi:sigma-70 family RNA polymerase sigma factor [Hyphomicrobium sp.]|uniref:sigma-70 family RNA polymerase sigma factor n=1 Tax=Hyphomicrobium sp. TaxID=82 RepID=UPI001DB15A98|nr:sigma-70 family RNA polymerase sigma factor [Hyphomicrobium sp.]MBY0560571.1 sigma-70 family RNA polymerase sigma factor [Hyphomicrobium sp.]
MDRKARDAEWTGLMRSAIAGDQVAYRRLLSELSQALRGVVRRGFAGVGVPASEVEDVVQDVLLAIHLKRHTWDQTLPLGPWVIAIARNKMIDDLRRRGRRPEVPVDLSEFDFEGEDQQASIDAHDVGRVLSRLSDKNRDIVQSISIDGQSARDVAERLGMSEVAVRVALHRSLKALADTYQEKKL